MVLIFDDSQSRYIFDQKIMHASGGSDNVVRSMAVSKHNGVSAAVAAKNFDYRLANSLVLNDAEEAEQTSTTYGMDYRYADNYHQPGSKFAEEQPGESSWFYAKLHHEIILNNQSVLSGVTTSPSSCTAGMVLNMTVPFLGGVHFELCGNGNASDGQA